MANLYFEHKGEFGEHLQLLGSHYNLTGLSEDQIKRAQEVLEDWVVSEEELQPEKAENGSYLEPGIEASVDEHKQVVQQLLNEVYNIDFKDIEKIDRSTAAKIGDEEKIEEDATELATDPERLRDKFQEVGIEFGNGEVDGYTQLDSDIHLNAVAIGLGLENIEYEPERFEGLVYRLEDPETTLVLFWEGFVTVIDASNRSAVIEGVNEVVERLQQLELIESGGPDEEEIIISKADQ